MTDKISEKLHEILVKLNKLGNIERTMSNLCLKMASVEGDIAKLNADTRATNT